MNKIIMAYFQSWKKNHVPMRAAALTYALILSIVPALAFCFYLFSRFANLHSLQGDLKVFLLKNLATGTGTHVTQYLDQFIANINFKKIGRIGLIGLLATSILLLTAVEESMNCIWQVHEKKPIWKRVIILLTLFTLGPVCFAISMTVTTYIAHYAPHLLLPANFGSIVITTLFFTFIFSIVPNAKVDFQYAFYSSAIVAVALEIAKWGYALYTSKYLFYNQVYGGLAALPFFLVWIFINWLIVLSGTQLNYIWQKNQELQK